MCFEKNSSIFDCYAAGESASLLQLSGTDSPLSASHTRGIDIYAPPHLALSLVPRCNILVLSAAGLARAIDVSLQPATLERLATVRAINEVGRSNGDAKLRVFLRLSRSSGPARASCGSKV
jgi:hypothetical protein